MNSNSICPWYPGIKVSPQEWNLSERNRIIALWLVCPNFYGWDKSQTCNLVFHPHEQVFGGNAISKIESQYSGTNNTAFLRYSSTFSDEKKMQCMMCFALPQCLNLLLYPLVWNKFLKNPFMCELTLYILFHSRFTCLSMQTFDVVPSPFYQCLIIMVFDARLRIFILVAWILMTGKQMNAIGKLSTG